MSWLFDDITYPVEAVYTQTLGFQPDVAMLRCLPQITNLPAEGTLTFLWGIASLTLPNCVVDLGSMRYEPRGNHVILLVKDRRERWIRAEAISGEYNIPRPSGIVNPKNLRQLVQLLLDALGETGADVSALPTTEYPYTSWECESVVEVGEELLAAYGYGLALGYGSEPVTIVQLGDGELLPNDNVFIASDTVDPKLIPRWVRSCFGHSVAQVRLKVSPVARETDGTWGPLDDASYAPAGGWGRVAPLSSPDLVADTDYLYYIGGVRRAYQVTGFADDTWTLPDGSGGITSLENILPIQGRLLEVEGLRESTSYTPMKIYGKITQGYKQAPAPAPPVMVTSAIGDEVKGRRFSFDGETGLLLFDEPVYYIDAGYYKPADLWIEVTIRIRDNTTRVWNHYEKDIEVAPTGIGWHTVKQQNRAETIIEYDSSHEVTGMSTNMTALDTIATNTAIAVAATYAAVASQFRVYDRPVLDLRCDGAIHQVKHVFTEGEREHAVNRTSASRFCELDRGVFTRSEKLAHQLALSVAARDHRSKMWAKMKEDAND
jgi:hypothetical protein